VEWRDPMRQRVSEMSSEELEELRAEQQGGGPGRRALCGECYAKRAAEAAAARESRVREAAEGRACAYCLSQRHLQGHCPICGVCVCSQHGVVCSCCHRFVCTVHVCTVYTSTVGDGGPRWFCETCRSTLPKRAGCIGVLLSLVLACATAVLSLWVTLS
jgi:hypothetical protein